MAWAFVATLVAPLLDADPLVTPDEGRNASAVIPPAPAGAPDDEWNLKLDHSTPPPALRIVLPPPERDEMKAMERALGKGPLAVGFHRDMPEAFAGDLVPRLEWVAQRDGSFVGVVSVTSPGAKALRAGLRGNPVAGIEIRFFGEHAGTRHPPLTARDFQREGDGSALLWSPTVGGDTIGIEIALPSEKARDAFTLRIEALAHTTLPAESLESAHKLDCPDVHIDVQCRADVIHDALQDAVARIRFEDEGLSYVCSGNLVNDKVTSTTVPYFLTANHCVQTRAVASSVEAWWFFQRATCGGATLDSRHPATTTGTDLLATDALYDLTLLRFRRMPPAGTALSGWSREELDHPVGAYGIHHPNGEEKKYSAGATAGSFLSDGVAGAIAMTWREGTTESGSSGSGLFLRDGGYLVGGLSHGPDCGPGITDFYGPFRHFYPQVRRWLDSESPPPDHALPLVTAASNLQLQGFVRVINLSDRAGTVRIDAIDDTGRRFGPVSLSLEARESSNFNSRDLEEGNSTVGLPGGVGDGAGDWRLELRTDLRIEARAYIRTTDGFLTSMHEVAEETNTGSMRYYVPFFNPGSNRSLVSRLRLVNPGAADAAIVIEAVDARGDPSPGGTVRLALPGEAARWVSARELEEGGPGLTGSLGDGAGKWRLFVSANHPLQVMGLMQTRSGHLSNLSR